MICAPLLAQAARARTAVSSPTNSASRPYPATSEHPAPAWFVDVATQAGIHVVNINGGVERKRYILEATGSGVAILDYDNDGWPDIFLVNGTYMPAAGAPSPGKPSSEKPSLDRPSLDKPSLDKPSLDKPSLDKPSLDKPSLDKRRESPPTSHLFHNNHDGTFTDVTAQAGLTDTGWSQGVCAGDYDNDGHEDLYVTGYGKNRLYHNRGNGTFQEVAETAGVAGSGKEWGTGCAFVDYDRDGKLDLVVSNYVHFSLADTPAPGQAIDCTWKGVAVMCGPRGLASAPNILYHNLGNGKFADVSKTSGIENTPGHYCFSVSTLDYDDDGWPDIFIACDSTPSILYRNNHDGTFTDKAADAGVAFNEDGREQAGMGSTVADYDGDGRPDIFKTNFSDDTSTLYHNEGDGTFSDVTLAAGVGSIVQDLGWGTMFMDMDNDGWPDLLVVNGHVYPEVDSGNLGSAYKEPRIVYRNLANGKFQDVSRNSGPGITTPQSSRGLAIGDLWNDGRLEAVVNNISDKPMLLVNVAKNPNHWLGVGVVGTQSNRDGIGARVTLHAGGRKWVEEVRSGSSYDSSNDLRLHFGLGPLSKVDELEVRWPNGHTEMFDGSEADRFVTLREGSGHAKP